MRTRARVRLAWLLFFVWASWACALQGELARSSALGSAVPDLTLVLFFALFGRAPAGRLVLAALALSLARAALSADPWVSSASGYLAIAVCLGSLHGLVDLERPLLRASFALGAALLLALWLRLGHGLRLDPRPLRFELWSSSLLLTAGATALLALLPAELVLRSLGLRALEARR